MNLRTGKLATGIPIIEVDAKTYRKLRWQATGTISNHAQLLNTVRWRPNLSPDRCPHLPLNTRHPRERPKRAGLPG